MAKDNEQAAADTATEKAEGPTGGGGGGILRILLPVGVAILAGAAGHLASQMAPPGSSEAAETSEPQARTPQDDENLTYYDLEPITVNLNEPQVSRYLRVILSLAIDSEDHGDASKTIEKKLPELKNWLIIFLSDLSLEDVRGAKNKNRIRRSIQDSLNDRLWPGERALIVKVIFKEWIVQ